MIKILKFWTLIKKLPKFPLLVTHFHSPTSSSPQRLLLLPPPMNINFSLSFLLLKTIPSTPWESEAHSRESNTKKNPICRNEMQFVKKEMKRSKKKKNFLHFTAKIACTVIGNDSNWCLTRFFFRRHNLIFSSTAFRCRNADFI